jgi:hypothetical protein
LIKNSLEVSSVAKPQRKFMFILLTALTYLPGRANFRNLGCYTPTFSRWFRRPFDFVAFNLLCLNALLDNGEWVAAIDASFHPRVCKNVISGKICLSKLSGRTDETVHSRYKPRPGNIIP